MFSAIYLSLKQKNRLNFFFIHFVWKQELLNARINTLRFHGAWFRKWSSIRNTEKNAHREEPKKSIGITVALNDDNDNKDDCRHLSVVCVAAKNELWPVQRTRVRKRERESVCWVYAKCLKERKDFKQSNQINWCVCLMRVQIEEEKKHTVEINEEAAAKKCTDFIETLNFVNSCARSVSLGPCHLLSLSLSLPPFGPATLSF